MNICSRNCGGYNWNVICNVSYIVLHFALLPLLEICLSSIMGVTVMVHVFLLLLGFSSSFSLTPGERCNISDDVQEQDNICLIYSYTNATGLSESVIAAEDIEFVLHDYGSGMLDVKFPILKKYFTYELRLNVIEKAQNEDECKTYADLKDYLLHSIRLFDIVSCKDDLKQKRCDPEPTCTKYTSVTFSHVFGGCYLLHITPKNNSSSGQPTTCHKMINSTHKKTLIWDMKPSVADQSYPDDHMARITFAYALLHELPVSLTLVQGVNLQQTQPCSKTGHKHSCCHLSNSAQLQCETIKEGIYHPFCELVNNQSKPVGSVACTFYNMTPGQYCVILEPIERDRCNPGTVWTRGLKTISPCKYQHIFSFKTNIFVNQSSTLKHIKRNRTTLITVGSVGALAAFLVLGVAMYNGLHYSFSKVPSMDLPAESQLAAVAKMKTHSHVLLLYAQDCQPFMKLMKTLRNILSNVGKCEVLDCFDPECSESLASAPEDWMLQAISRCRVVLVINDCGAELQKKTHVVYHYRHPLPYCHLFLLGLRKITSSPSSREYCKIFVVRFDGQDLKFITPHIRFLLPQNICELLKCINPSCDKETLEEYNNQKLKDDIEEYLCYKDKYPNYVENLMMIDENL